MQLSQPAALKEKRRHGDDHFPIGLYYMELLPGEMVVDCHWHDEAEFLYVVEGGTLFQIGEHQYPVHEGEAVFIHGGEIHAGFPHGDHGCRFYAIVFDMNWLNSPSYDVLQSEYMSPILNGYVSLPPLFSKRETWAEPILHHLQNMIRVLENRPPGYALAVKSNLYSILFEIASHDRWFYRPLHDARNSDLNRLKKVLRYIETHYNENIKLSDLANVAHMSEGHFCRFFKAMTRTTSIEYINRYRISRAAEWLKQSDRKIAAIAHEVGFENISYFIKTFKRLTGFTPHAYRKYHWRQKQKNLPFVRKDVLNDIWRKGWDSNPRTPNNDA